MKATPIDKSKVLSAASIIEETVKSHPGKCGADFSASRARLTRQLRDSDRTLDEIRTHFESRAGVAGRGAPISSPAAK